ncbi:S-adenosyl-L-methionine-dependent methyltransferase [Penicillium chermesinum]|uniref:S-adenosyl-L-methionine-dependent methyltransferase n=1 Tax=Penicillium chermesinum TaxID=63820 RepID=A0A9W9TW41_9EURO|nr:S-adenosyl-L-methionine-dependent methyltransferase [Penicillium chermesinum]KAJ5245946.1 S-adenosyl-L-methionine-dependent methyltransferase [Penicillium chermesinum]
MAVRNTFCRKVAFNTTIRGSRSISSHTEDTTNVWKLNVEDDIRYWTGYLSTRPKYTTEFYDLIYAYHDAHSNCSNLAHDVGAGPGQVSAKLAKRFKHVVVSDNNPNHVDFALYQLKSQQGHPGDSSFSFKVARGEELGGQYASGSADLVVCALTFPLLDTEAALRSFHTLLKPGSTLAIWFYGRAHFAEPEYASRCQPLLDTITDHHFRRVIQADNMAPATRASWKRTADGIASWLDYIPFHESDWIDVERRKWNSSWTTMGFFTNRACGFPVEPVSRVTPREKVLEIEDPELWRKDWTVDQLKSFANHIFPFPYIDEESVRPVWKRLQWEMGGAHAKRAFSWPVALTLASKR